MPTKRKIETIRDNCVHKIGIVSIAEDHPVATAIALSCLLSFISMFSVNYANIDDDFGISVALSGRYPDSGLCLFVNAIISNICFFANSIFPNINAFWFLEGMSCCLAFMRLYYLSFKFGKTRPLLYVASIVCTFLIMPGCTSESNFTLVAGICILSGFLGYGCLFAIGKKYQRENDAYYFKESVINSLLIVLGFCFRQKVLMLMFPFVVFFLVGLRNDLIFRSKKIIALLMPLVLAIVFVNLYDVVSWSNSPWSDWLDYNNFRSITSDYPLRDYSEIKDRLATKGLSENDYLALKIWMTADTNVFDLSSMKLFSTCYSNGSFVDTISNIPSSFFGYCVSFVEQFQTKCLLLVAIITMFVSAYNFCKRKSVVLILFLCTFLYAVGFVAIGRFPARVEIPVWSFSFALLAIIESNKVPKFSRSKPKTFIYCFSSFCVCVLFIFCGFISSFSFGALYTAFNQDKFEPENGVVKYCNSHPEDVFVYDVMTYASNVESAYKNRYIPSTEFLMKNITFGGWSTMSPFWNKKNECLGTDSYFRSLCTEDNWYFVTFDLNLCDFIKKFVKEHYGISVEWHQELIPNSNVQKIKFVVV